MSKIYVVIKCAKEAAGEWVMATTEAAFTDTSKAQMWLNKQPIVWEENINGAVCYCERAIHDVELQ